MSGVAERLVLRPAEPRDIPAILALNRRFYAGEDWVSERFFAWRFGDTAAGGHITWLAFDGDTLAGTYSVFPLRFWVGGQERLGSASWATLTNPDYARVILRRDGRLKSIFIALADLAFDECRRRGVEFCYTFPNQKSYDGFVKHLSFEQLDTLRFRVCPLHFAPLLARKFPKWSALAWALAGPAKLAYRLLKPRRATDSSVVVEPVAWDDPRLDSLWQRCRAGWPILQVRDRGYYHWRFATNPFADYTLLLATERSSGGSAVEAAPLGMLVYTRRMFQDRERGAPLDAGAIADWLTTNDARGAVVLHKLLSAAVDALARDDTAAVISADNRDGQWNAAFRAAGFETFCGPAAPKQFPLTLRTFSAAPMGVNLRDAAQWFLTFGDNDVV